MPWLETIQASPAILASEQADVRVADEDPRRVVRIDVHAVRGRHVEPARGPLLRTDRFGVHLGPLAAAVERAIGAEQVRHVRDVGVARADARYRRARRTRCRAPASPRVPRATTLTSSATACCFRGARFATCGRHRPCGRRRCRDRPRPLPVAVLRTRDTRPCRGLRSGHRRGSGRFARPGVDDPVREARATPRARCCHHLERRTRHA